MTISCPDEAAAALEITDNALNAVPVSTLIRNDALFDFCQCAEQGGGTFDGPDGCDDIRA